MARKKRGKPKLPTHQLVVRLTAEMDHDLRWASEGLGMDVSDLVRMLLKLHLPEYFKKAQDAEALWKEFQAKMAATPPPKMPRHPPYSRPGLDEV